MEVIVITIVIVLIIVGLISGDTRPTAEQRARVEYSKDYMNNPIVRNMNERDHK